MRTGVTRHDPGEASAGPPAQVPADAGAAPAYPSRECAARAPGVGDPTRRSRSVAAASRARALACRRPDAARQGAQPPRGRATWASTRGPRGGHPTAHFTSSRASTCRDADRPVRPHHPGSPTADRRPAATPAGRGSSQGACGCVRRPFRAPKPPALGRCPLRCKPIRSTRDAVDYIAR